MQEIMKYEYYSLPTYLVNASSSSFFAQRNYMLSEKVKELFKGKSVLLKITTKNFDKFFVFYCDKRISKLDVKHAYDLIIQVIRMAEYESEEDKEIVAGMIEKIDSLCDPQKSINDPYDDEVDDPENGKSFCSIM